METITCKYCNEAENKQTRPGLICATCTRFVHLACLRSQGTPGNFAADVFFDFLCEDCSPNKAELIVRPKMPWVNVLILTLNHLSVNVEYNSNHGFYHYKTQICTFIDSNFVSLFGATSSKKKKKKNLLGTVAGVLSKYSNIFFRSGSITLGEPGWWQLMHRFSPAAAAHISYKHYINYVAEIPVNLIATGGGAKKRPHPNSSENKASFSAAPILVPSVSSSRNVSRSLLCGMEWEPLVEQATSSVSHLATGDNSDVRNTSSGFTFAAPAVQPSKNEGRVDRAKKRYEPGFPTHSLVSSAPNTTRMPWPDDADKPKEQGNIVELTPYEEMELLENVRNRKVKKPNKKVELHRQRAKLAQRKLERDCNLITLFDLVEPFKIHENVNPRRDFTKAGRVFDRFQNLFLIDRSGTIPRAFCGTLLLSDIKPTTIRSEYSGKTLKPFIRRDSTSTAPWLKLMDELLRVTHRDIKDYSPPPRHTIDYSFVRPQHIAAINKMCEQFFWPAIDLSEALEYPEFSCVVTYKRVVVAFAFLVPESCRNEAYISFMLVRPEWRRAKIASNMLYHLLQVCRDKDVTLHCSPANPAIFLYQKFGFTAEEMIQNFYVHLDGKSRDCRHAKFMRLRQTTD